MNRQPGFSLSRAFGVLVLLAAWFALSNHCSLAVMGYDGTAANEAALHKCCPGKGAGNDEQAPDKPNGACCKALRVLPADAGAKLVKAPNSLPLVAWVWATLAEVLTAERPVAKTASTPGPPGVRSFAEVVLQRSLLSHAPPFAA